MASTHWRALHPPSSQLASPGQLTAPVAYLQRIRVRGADRIRVIATAEIDWVRAKGWYTHIHVGGAVYLHRETLRHLLGELDPERFLRIHRRTLVNVERIREVRAQLQGNTEVLLQNGTRLALSRRFRVRVRNALAARGGAWLGVLLVVAAISAPARSAAQQADYSHYMSPWKTPWDYAGPKGAEHWSELDPEYAVCNRGKEQSPIDIRSTQKAELPPIRFAYQSEPIRYVINNGYTIRVNYHDAPGSGNFLLVGDKRYQLTQFHFHRPSEEYVHGKQYDMVLHLMHQSSDGEVAGVAVLLRVGRANATIAQLWEHMPASEGQEAVAVALNPADMLPHNTGYYMYMGSVTAPPCTEGVKWFVLKTPVDISAAQVAAFARLYPNDVRPLQPLNGRIVKESQ
jgi:carbonic anhydrase